MRREDQNVSNSRVPARQSQVSKDAHGNQRQWREEQEGKSCLGRVRKGEKEGHGQRTHLTLRSFRCGWFDHGPMCSYTYLGMADVK